MNVREWMDKNPAVTTLGAVVLLVVALGSIVWNFTGGGGGGPIPFYYYDLNNGHLFVAQSDRIPPIPTDSQQSDTKHPNGVQAFIYSCGQCPDLRNKTVQDVKQAGAKLAYLQMYTIPGKKAKKAARAGKPMKGVDPTSQLMVKAMGQGEKWHQIYSNAGMRVQDALPQCSGGKIAKLCHP